jgi:hypoxanthine phosphoribosyltransferase
MSKIKTVGGLVFIPFIEAATIKEKVKEIASRIKSDYKGLDPIFIVVMNGAFVYAADLLRRVNIDCDIKFVQVKSYVGIDNSGDINVSWPPDTDLSGRHIVIIEDIVDTGITINRLLPEIQAQNPKSVEITSIFVKPAAHQYQINIKYSGIEIPEAFIIGYGLDYNGLGRNLKDIYQLKD